MVNYESIFVKLRSAESYFGDSRDHLGYMQVHHINIGPIVSSSVSYNYTAGIIKQLYSRLYKCILNRIVGL